MDKVFGDPTDEGMEADEDYFQGMQDDERGADEFVWPQRTTVDVVGAVQDAYARVDDLHNGVQQPGQIPRPEMEPEDDCEIYGPDYEELVRDSNEPIYEGCRVNRLQVAIVLITMCSLFSIPYTFLDELLKFLSQDLLPKSINLPRTSHEARRLVLKLGLKHEAIHCCPDGHVLYRGDNKDLVSCPHRSCGKSRYVEGSSTIPCKVFRYFPIIEQLQRMFKCPDIAKMMTFHSTNKSEEPMMKSVVDGEQWKHIDETYPNFAANPTNLRIGLVGDGVNPYGNNSTKHSVWPFLVVIYNLPPWLASKNFFLKLVMLIPGPQAPTSEVIDIYLEPLLEDLLKLWEGVSAIDMSKPIGHRRFTLRAILLWLVHDFPAYGLLSGQQTKGYKGCPLCGEETCAEHSGVLGKMVYLGGRRFLDLQHRFRNARRAFNGQTERMPQPKRQSGHEIYAKGLEREQYLHDGGIEESDNDPVKKHGVKRASIFYRLPYWAVCQSRQLTFLFSLFNVVLHGSLLCKMIAVGMHQ